MIDRDESIAGSLLWAYVPLRFPEALREKGVPLSTYGIVENLGILGNATLLYGLVEYTSNTVFSNLYILLSSGFQISRVAYLLGGIFVAVVRIARRSSFSRSESPNSG
jgi:hypothetical protein